MYLSDTTKPVCQSSEKIIDQEKSPGTIHKKWIIMFVASLFLALFVTFSAILLTQQYSIINDKDKQEEEIIVFPPIEENQVISVKTHKIINKLEWGGQKSLTTTVPLNLPVDLVIIAHTVTPLCSNIEQCSRIVRSAQNYHFKLGFPDITYNFLIGGDGNIYVGRGWDITNGIKNQSIAVSLIGNYVHDELSDDMIDALKMLLLEGVKLGKVAEDYKIVCHNQLFKPQRIKRGRVLPRSCEFFQEDNDKSKPKINCIYL